MGKSTSSRIAITIVLVLFLAGAFTLYNPSAKAAGTIRFGFWLQESNIFAYPANTFFNAMFLTSPYPSSMEVMIFAIQQAETNNQGCATGSGYIGQSLTYWGTVAKDADSYPNIRLVFEIAFDGSSGGSGTYGLSCFNAMAQSLAQYPSVYGIGIEGEYTGPQTSALYTAAYNDVTALHKVFVNYYAQPGVIPAGGYDIYHTNFPGGDAGGYDQVGSLQLYDSQTIGMDSGYYANFQFPGTVTCPIGATAMNSGTAGWNQCVVNTEFSTASTFTPASARQYLEIDVGFSASGSFTGVSGQTTTQLWDSPVLRNMVATWLTNNPGNPYILGTSSYVTTYTSTIIPPTTTTGTSTSTSTSVYTSTFPTTATSTIGNALYQDGSATNSMLSATSLAITLSTTYAPDIILLFTSIDSTAFHVSTVVAPGLTFTQRAHTTANNNFDVEEWIATASSPLTFEKIVIGNSGTDNMAAAVLGVYGSSGFDGSTSMTSSSAGSTTPATTISTSNAADMIVGFMASQVQSGQTLTVGSGFTLIASNVGSGVHPNVGDEFKTVSTTQSGLSVGFTLGTSKAWTMMADALEQQPITTSTSTGTTTTTGTSTSLSTSVYTSTVGTTTITSTVNNLLNGPPCGNEWLAYPATEFAVVGTNGFTVTLGSNMFACSVQVTGGPHGEVYFDAASLGAILNPEQSFGLNVTAASNTEVTGINFLEIDTALTCTGSPCYEFYYYTGSAPIGNVQAMSQTIPLSSYVLTTGAFASCSAPCVYNSGTYLEVKVSGSNPIPVVFINEVTPTEIVGTFSYTIFGGGALNLPTLAYVYLGTPYNVTMNSFASEYVMDLNSAWAVTNPLHGSNGYQRWLFENGNTTGTVRATFTEAYDYYRQENVPVYYTLSDAVNTLSPTFTYSSFGVQTQVTNSKAPVAYWIDYNVPWSPQTPFTTVPDLKTFSGTPPVGTSIDNTPIVIAYGSYNSCGSSNPLTQFENGCIIPAILYTWSYPIGLGPWFSFVLLGICAAIYGKTQSIAMSLIVLLVTGATFGFLLPATVGVIAQIFLYISVAGLAVRLVLLAR